ncbi:efflux RND transporter periplasmic adaptor subunit [Brevibacillus migulae]|uniref:efflux RND transporter periplasmic adaptor subunit n=1 Tax=Brevibacillus migulae TaxID=1644114 RepID=UPI00106E98A2|nr:hypothetical protein [Brevibacillus migulae]
MFSKVFIGQDAIITGGTLGTEKVKARVVRMDPVAHNQSGNGQDKVATITVYLSTDAPAQKLIPGVNVDVDLIDQRALLAIQIPYDAVSHNQQGESFVWKVTEDKAHLAKVETGIKDERNIEIKSGLQQGDTVILSPSEELQEGQPVRITPQPSSN